VLEQLVTDYTRKGFVTGRPVRLPTVSVRPGRPNAAASGFLSGIIREPLAGQRAVCPVPPPTPVALTSPSRAIAGLLRAAAVSSADFGPPIAMNLPSISTTVAAMVDALSTVAGPETAALIDWVPDPVIETIVANWPARVAAGRANALGLAADPDFTSIVREYLDA
jgi:D-erythronate 2-dehydrogenase